MSGVRKLGILVASAQKMEEGVERLKTNLREIAEDTMAIAEPRLRATWKDALHSLEHSGSGFRPVRRKIVDLRNELSHRTAVSLDRAESRARITFLRMIENTIDELEKIRRTLERDPKPIWHAA